MTRKQETVKVAEKGKMGVESQLEKRERKHYTLIFRRSIFLQLFRILFILVIQQRWNIMEITEVSL